METEGDVGPEEACVNLETDFEQRIDEINNKKLDCNGVQSRKRRSGKNPDYRDNSDSESSERNGYLLPSTTKKKKSKSASKSLNHSSKVVKLPGPSVERSGKPFSHQMRECGNKAAVPRLVVKSGGKPRSMMLEMCNNNNTKKKASSSHNSETNKSFYRSQITDDNNAIKMKIKKTNIKKAKRKKSHVTPSRSKDSSTKQHKKKHHRDQIIVEQVQEESSDEEDNQAVGAKLRHSAAAPALLPPPVLLPTVLVTPTTIAKPKETKKKSSQSKGSKSHSKLSEERPAVVQGPWGSSMPEEVLVSIFSHVVSQQGALPALVKLGEVCRLWHSASMTPRLWTNIELSQYTKDKFKMDHRLVWLMENRLSMCQQLNLSNWKVSNLPWVVESLVACCPLLEDINLTGWKRLSVDQLKEITHGLTKLSRLDLSCTSEASSSGGCLSVLSLTQTGRGMGERLTHLTLANNKLAGLPSILNSIADHCPNLELLDLSNLWAVSHPAMVPLERLQKGCSKLKVLRITNSQVVLATASTQDQMESPGFPLLEELSVACPSVDYKLVDDEALGRILKGSTCLRLLDVRGCIRITDSGLIKVPAWDLQHLFLSGCAVTRQCRSCLELICEKWSHSLVEVDLAWATATQPLDAAVDALADRGQQSKLRILNLCGSSVSLDPVKRILIKCPNLDSVNLASCRALPRGMKRHYIGKELQDLKDSFDPVKKKEKEEQDKIAKDKKKKAQEDARKLKEDAKIKEEGKDAVKEEVDVKSPSNISSEISERDDIKSEADKNTSDSSPAVQSTNKVTESGGEITPSTEQDYSPQPNNTFSPAPKSSASAQEPFSPQPSTSGISTPRSNLQEFSPASSQVTTDPISASNMCDSDSRQGTPRASSGWNTEQCSPMNKQDTLSSSQPSPDTGYSPANVARQDTPKSTGNWNIGNYSPSVVRQESPYSSQNSPSVIRQESPYSSQKSPSVVRLESPYSSQKSPSVASPYSSQIRSPSVIRQESPYSSVKSPSMVRQESPYSSHLSPSVVRQESPYSSHVSPSVIRQESPYSSHVSPSMGRQESPYSSQKSPYQSVKSPYTSQKSPDPPLQNKPNQSSGWNVDQYSPLMRQESASSSQPSPERVQTVTKPWNFERFSPMQSSTMMPSPDTSQVTSTGKQWNLDRFSPMTRAESSPANTVSSPDISIIKSSSQSWNTNHPSSELGHSVLKSSWSVGAHLNPLLRPEQLPTSGSVSAHLDAHKSNWNLNQFSRKMDSCSSVLPSRMTSSDPLPSMWRMGSGVVVNNKSDLLLQRTGGSVGGAYASDQVTTTTYCNNTDQNIYRNYRGDPINGPSGVD